MQSRQLALGAALVATAVLAAPSPASAAADTVVQLEYRAGEQSGCVGQDELRRMVVEQLRHDPFRTDADRRVAVTLSRTEGGFQGRIAWTDARGRSLGERLLSSRSRDCREIAANVAFAVALQLQLVEHGTSNEGRAGTTSVSPQPKADEDGQHASAQANRPISPTERPLGADAEQPLAPPPQRPEASVPDRPPAPSEPPPVNPGPDSPDRLRLVVGLGPAIGIGMMPSATAFAHLFVAARFHHFSAEIAGDTSLPETLTRPDHSAVDLYVVGPSAAGCAHVSALSACLLGRYEWLRAHGSGVDAPATPWARFGQVGLRLAASRELGRIVISARADGLMMLSRWNVLLNQSAIWRVPRVGGFLGVDVALRFF